MKQFEQQKQEIVDFLNSEQACSSIMCQTYEKLFVMVENLTLKVKQLEWDDTNSAILDFFAKITTIDYDDGFGVQELFGYILFNDNTWLERYEYDGSEWWEYKTLPTRDSIDKQFERECGYRYD